MILSSHYQKIFNHDAPFDPTIINEIKQRDPVNPKIGEPPTFEEITAVINCMKNNKTPCLTSISTDMLKCLPPSGLGLLTKIFSTFWNEPKTDFNSWHITKLVTLYKGKGQKDK